MQLKTLATGIVLATSLVACGGGGGGGGSADVNPIDIANVRKVLETNADIAYASYSDSVETAKALQTALAALRADPTELNLAAAKKAWLVAREPYGQTEVYRFRLSPIDSTDYASEDGPEGDINAWPLGEALIDYVVIGGDFADDEIGVVENSVGINGGLAVDSSNHTGNNIIAQTSIVIDEALVSNTAMAEDEHDVIAGYHAIEFMLWGQDLNDEGGVTDGDDRDEAVKAQGAPNIANGGQRPLSDFVPGYDGTAVNYDSSELSHRRHKYLEIVVAKLIADLEGVRDAWADDVTGNYRDLFTTVDTETQAKQKLAEILTGMGTLSEGELAGERMQIAFNANSQEDEHSCFSDNTHRDIWLDAEGVANSYYGDYAGYDSDLDGVDDAGTVVSGYGLDDYIADSGISVLQDLATEFEADLAATETQYKAIDSKARSGEPFDVLIGSQNSDNPIYKAILALNAQSSTIADVAEALEIDAEVVQDDASECDTSNPDQGC